MLTLRDKSNRGAKSGFLVKAVRGGFDFAETGDTPIGVLYRKIGRSSWLIQDTGIVNLFVEHNVVPGQELRMPVSGEGGRAGTARAVGDATSYTSIGRAVGKGVGLIEVALNIAVGSGGGGGLPAGGTVNQVLTKLSGADDDADWQTPAAGILDAVSDGTGYIRSDAGWVTSSLLLDYTGGTGALYDQVEYGEALSFASTSLSIGFTSTLVGSVVTKLFTINYTPPGNFYDGWSIVADTGDAAANVISTGLVSIVGGSYITTDMQFATPGGVPPATYDVTIEVDTAALRGHLDSYYYDFISYPNLINDAATSSASIRTVLGDAKRITYGRYNNNWVDTGLIIDYSGGTGAQTARVGYDERVTLVGAGSGMSTSYSFASGVHTLTITHTPAGAYYSGWYAQGDTSDAPVLVGSGITMTFVGGDYIDTHYDFLTPNHAVTFDVDYAQMRTDRIFYSSDDVDGLIANFITDAPSDLVVYGRNAGSWVNAGLQIEWGGGAYTDILNYGAKLKFAASGSLSTAYNDTTHTVTYSYTAPAVYTDWNLYVDSVKKADITSGDYANWAAGTGISLAFTSPGSPVMNTVTITNTSLSPWTTDTYGITYGSHVGIGVASHSTYQLYVLGTTYLSGNATVNGLITATTANFGVTTIDESAGYTLILNDEAIIFTRPSYNYFHANQSGGFLNFTTNGRSLSGTSSMLVIGTTDVILKYGTGVSAPATKLTTVSAGVSITGALTATSEITAYSSDRRLKKNIRIISNPLDIIDSIDGVYFDWKNDVEKWGFIPTRKTEIGFIAQNLGDAIHDAVAPAPFDQDGTGRSISGKNFLTTKPEKVIPVLVEAIKELRREIKELKRVNSKY